MDLPREGGRTSQQPSELDDFAALRAAYGAQQLEQLLMPPPNAATLLRQPQELGQRSGGEMWGSRMPVLGPNTLADPLLQLPFLSHDLFGQQSAISLQQQQPTPDTLPLQLDTGPQQQAPQQTATKQRGAPMGKDAKQALARQKNREVSIQLSVCLRLACASSPSPPQACGHYV
jgi:hypothetical protein